MWDTIPLIFVHMRVFILCVFFCFALFYFVLCWSDGKFCVRKRQIQIERANVWKKTYPLNSCKKNMSKRWYQMKRRSSFRFFSHVLRLIYIILNPLFNSSSLVHVCGTWTWSWATDVHTHTHIPFELVFVVIIIVHDLHTNMQMEHLHVV